MYFVVVVVVVVGGGGRLKNASDTDWTGGNFDLGLGTKAERAEEIHLLRGAG